MKTVTFALLTCLVLPLGAEAKGKAKPAPKSTAPSTDPQPIKGKLIDMTPAEEVPEGIISTEVTGRDLEFFMTAYEIGGLETWLGEQAKVRGEADKVKAVGDALQSTQAEENELLHKLAKKKGVALPVNPVASARQKEQQERLAKTAGPAFDKAVMDEISAVTQQAVDAYVKAAASKDAEIQSFANQILPMVKEKLALAKRLAGKPAPIGAKPSFHDSSPPPLPPPPPPRSPVLR